MELRTCLIILVVVCVIAGVLLFGAHRILLHRGNKLARQRRRPDIVRIKLEGRIYPAIKSCVRNRYLIVSGYLAYAALLVSHPDIKELIYCGSMWKACAIPAVFTAFVIHNFLNYVMVAEEQLILENNAFRRPFDEAGMEIVSAIASALIIWFGYSLLKRL